MNYHIFPANIFFNSYIEDIYLLHEEKNNVFWVRGNESDNKYLKTSRPITFIGHDEERIVSLLKRLRNTDKLFISWYDIFIGKCVLKAGITCELYVYLMGGEFYDDPPGFHNKWLFDRKTTKIVNKLTSPHVVFLRKPKNWHKIVDEIIQKLNHNKKLHEQYVEKSETISRIDYLITVPHNQSEIELISKLYPTFQAKYLSGGFDQNVDLSINHTATHNIESHNTLRILLGNSSNPTNNHLDAFSLITKRLKINYEIYAPLSYGDDNYSKIVQKYATRIWKEKFHPITQFMERSQYIEFLKTIDIVIMYHNRQQAYGNIITSLMLGKPIFMKKNNASFKTFSSIGIKSIFDIKLLNDKSVSDAILYAQKNILETRLLLIKYFSREQRLLYLSKLLMQ